MNLLRYEKSGQRYPRKAGHHWLAKEAQVANVGDNGSSEVAAWRRTYMRRWRTRSRVAEAPEPVKQPQLEDNPTPPIKERKPPPKGERKGSWAARGAEQMKPLREDLLRRAARNDGAAGSGLTALIEAREMTARGYWANKTSGILRLTVEAYLGGDELGETGLIALRQYLKRSIPEPNWRCGGLEGLHQRVEGLDTREKLKEWLRDALELGINPL